jgi:hypothetical protein
VPAPEGPWREALDLLRRGLLVLLASARLVGTRPGAWFATLGGSIFETYLLHVPLIGILWVAWSTAVGGPGDPSYLGFFLAAPVAAVAAGRALSAILGRSPPWLQRLARGRAATPRAAGVPARAAEAAGTPRAGSAAAFPSAAD